MGHTAASHLKSDGGRGVNFSSRSESFSFSRKWLRRTNRDWFTRLCFGSESCVRALGVLCRDYSIVFLVSRLQRCFQSGVCELEIFFFFFFLFRFRLSTCQSEHLCKLLVSLTTINIFKHLLKVPLTALLSFLFWFFFLDE